MRKNAYKNILDFLIAVNRNAARGQHLKHLQFWARRAKKRRHSSAMARLFGEVWGKIYPSNNIN
jgi:hypothetical protein